MKDYENDLNYLKEQFSKDDLTVPDSLSEDAVFAMLENVPQMQPAAPPAVRDQRYSILIVWMVVRFPALPSPAVPVCWKPIPPKSFAASKVWLRETSFGI